ncbi:sulfatase-like hydrolase/transferase [Vibrio hibernica]|uniref:sulfatase-like hydrolase/transferase n=2 Tax=Vibrio hibernica TaxID=2587465 RepID=UPI001881F966|nr:sulfatase-like hydrolase/transferase [Vibrio hibernica]
MLLNKKFVSASIAAAISIGVMNPVAFASGTNDLKATKTNVAFSDIDITQYTTADKPNVIILTVDDLGYGQMDFDERSFDQKYLNERKVVDTYKVSIEKAIEAAKKSTPTLKNLIGEGVKITNGYVAHGVSGPSRAAMMTGRSPARFGVYS